MWYYFLGLFVEIMLSVLTRSDGLPVMNTIVTALQDFSSHGRQTQVNRWTNIAIVIDMPFGLWLTLNWTLYGNLQSSFFIFFLRVGCVDVDECEDPESCGPNSACTNSIGSFSCACPEDIETEYCGTNTVCTNSAGSFSCACLPGYEPWVAGQAVTKPLWLKITSESSRD